MMVKKLSSNTVESEYDLEESKDLNSVSKRGIRNFIFAS